MNHDTYGGEFCLGLPPGYNISIWMGFDLSLERQCELDSGSYILQATNAPTQSPTAGPTTSPTTGPTTSPSSNPSDVPTADPSVQPTTHVPTLDPTQPPWTASCDYSYVGPYEVVKESILETVVLYDVVSLRFKVMTAVNFTCSADNGYCNFFRLGANATSSYLPRLPQITWVSGSNAFRIAIHRNNGSDAWEISNDSYVNTFNDGEYHQYELYMSPTQRIFIYDNITFVNSTDDYDASDYLNATGREWILTISMNDDLQSGDAYVRDFCIETYALTANPTSDPTISPSANPTQSPTAVPSDGPTTSPSSNPSADPTSDPSLLPTSLPPTQSPTAVPTKEPTSGSPTNASPTVDPSVSPSANPTSVPSGSPTSEPPSAHPTSADMQVNVSFAGVPEISTSFLTDPYGLCIVFFSPEN